MPITSVFNGTLSAVHIFMRPKNAIPQKKVHAKMTTTPMSYNPKIRPAVLFP